MSTRRIHVRAPGVKTGSRIGPLGPFRGTLGIQWVVGAIALGLVIVLAVTWILFRKPGVPFREVEAFTIDQVTPGTAREALPSVFVGVTEDGTPVALRHPQANCELEFTEGRYVDCHDWSYDIAGHGQRGRALTALPVEIHRGTIFIDTSAPR